MSGEMRTGTAAVNSRGDRTWVGLTGARRARRDAIRRDPPGRSEVRNDARNDCRLGRQIALWLLLTLAGTSASAAIRASLDRDQIRLGETVTLTVEVEGISGDPDFGHLPAGLTVRGQSNSRETRVIAGQVTTSTVWTLALEPGRIGEFTIPAFEVAGERSAPIVLRVAESPRGVAAAGEPVFLDAEIDSREPYVGQLVVYTVRLHYAVQLIDGDLHAPEASVGELRQIGRDRNYSARIDGREYAVVERRFAYLPGQRGAVALAPARFRGRALDNSGRLSMFGGRVVAAIGPDLDVQVRPRPAGTADPWLPAQAITIAQELPSAGPIRAGEPFTLRQTARIEGVVSEQFAAPPVPQIPGAQVFEEAPEFTETLGEHGPVLEWRRSLAGVPDRPGTLEIPAWHLDWWNLASDRADRAGSQPLSVTVEPASTRAGGIALGDAQDAPGSAVRPGFWPWLSLLLAGGWVATAWRLYRIRRPAGPVRTRAAEAGPGRRSTLDRALGGGDLSAIAEALIARAPAPRPNGLPALAERLVDDDQAQAVLALDRVLWGRGDPAATRERLRAAFARPPRFRSASDADDGVPELPPLNP